MNEETKKQLQDFIDRDFELAEKHVAEMKSKYGIRSDLNNNFCLMVCYDLAREYGLDLKGVIPE